MGNKNEEEHIHIHAHAHVHTHAHKHTHKHTQTKAVLNRMSRIIGHMEAVKKMVEDGRDCTDVLIQLSAVRSALNGVGRVILKDHVDHCIVDAAASGDMEALEKLDKAIEQFVK